MYVLSYVCMYVLSYVCMYVLSYVCMYVLSYVCMYVLSYLCILRISSVNNLSESKKNILDNVFFLHIQSDGFEFCENKNLFFSLKGERTRELGVRAQPEKGERREEHEHGQA